MHAKRALECIMLDFLVAFACEIASHIHFYLQLNSQLHARFLPSNNPSIFLRLLRRYLRQTVTHIKKNSHEYALPYSQPSNFHKRPACFLLRVNFFGMKFVGEKSFTSAAIFTGSSSQSNRSMKGYTTFAA